MLHPDLRRALATAHIEDLHRAATPRQRTGLRGTRIRRPSLARLRLLGRRRRRSDSREPRTEF
jgi:hypothetical protein